MTLHVIRRARDTGAVAEAARAGDGHALLLIGAGIDNAVPPGVRCYVDGVDLDDAAIVRLLFQAERVIAW